MSYRADFHTHSVASPDGALGLEHYRRMLQKGGLAGGLDFIAVTDHNTIAMARQIHAELGDRIIIGEEITAQEGEVIGLYLTEAIPPLLTVLETVEAIHKQGGLVYVPHPFETVRKGLSYEALQGIAKHVDVIEVHNGRAVFQNFSEKALSWAKEHGVPGAASSDAHGFSGWGKTYTMLSKVPARQNLAGLLQKATYKHGFAGLHGMLYPKINRWSRWQKRRGDV
jgi:predicted metal-dependent phosphoesterase TrpH